MRLTNFQLQIYWEERRLGATARDALRVARLYPQGYGIGTDRRVRMVASVAAQLRGYLAECRDEIENPRWAFRLMYHTARMEQRP
ncbi:hypothetical protein ACI2VE_18205 [Ralstonia nicotianae]